MSTERKSVVMPDPEEMIAKIQEDPEITRQLNLGVLLGMDVAESMVSFLKRVANRVGNRKMDGYGLNDQWTRAAADTLETPPTAGVFIQINIIHSNESFFGRVMTIIVPDQEVLADSLDLRQRYLEELTRLGMSERQEWAHLGDWD